MHDAITDVAGIDVGHATDAEALTGCTAVLCRAGAVVGVDVRGPAPGTRETDLCRPGTLVERAHAVVLCGGSAFGLEAASGVTRHLAAEGVGFDAWVARVPIVPAAVIFDLGLGKPAWPDLEAGRRAAAAASVAPPEQGCVGAGTGATVGKMLGPVNATKGGIGTASVRAGDSTVGALVVVNAGGDVVDPVTGAIVAGARQPETGAFADSVALIRGGVEPPAPGAQTTLAVVATDAALTVEQANHVAAVAHDGLARVIRPAHTMFDGDTAFALATRGGEPPAADALTVLAVFAVDAVERATLNAVRHATPMGGLPAAAG
ncbi:MAG TPA: P1 family peptidase [Solirubrobacteraceae bacterium]|nr:P1 family peptidase [Solirubrobacteraceae bacterium]